MSRPDEPTVVVDRVSKWFGPKVAVSEVACSFGPGLTGLLGPNGAGKTTLLRMLVGLLTPSEGTVTLLGERPRRDPSVFAEVAIVPEHEAVYDFQTARQFIAFNAGLYGVSDPASAAERAIATVGLEDAADRQLAGFSKGMRQRAKVGAALAHDPKVLVLDEPLNGTDPVQRAHLIDVLVGLGREGRTVIVSSHVLHEVERMADRVVAMVDGRLAASGTVSALRSAMSDIPRRIRIDTNKPRALGPALLTQPFVEAVTVDDDVLHVDVRDGHELGTHLPRLAKDLEATITRVAPEDESLESVFRYLVHR